MGSAVEYLSSEPDVRPLISVDEQISNKVIGIFNFIENGLEQKSHSRDELVYKIVEAELSEWNDIFLYVVSSLAGKTNKLNM